MLETLPQRVRPHKPDAETVARYAELYRDSTARQTMPPIVVFCESGCERYIVSDGEHRLEGAKRAKLEELPVDLREGNEVDALDFALSCNVTHGLPRSIAGNWHAFCLLMDTPALRSRHKTDTDKANALGVHRNTVVKYKADHRDCAQWAQMSPTQRRKRLLAQRKKEREEDTSREAEPAPDDDPARAGVSSSVDEPAKAPGRKERKKRQPMTPEQKRIAKQARDDLNRQRLNDNNRKTITEGLAGIRSMPFSGAHAAKEWPEIETAEIAYVRDWCDEFLRARE